MEGAGLVIGAVTLASLFSTCVECFDFVTLARHHERDYHIALTKLVLLKARLGAWGAAVQATSPGNELPALQQQWDENKEAVKSSLEGVYNLLQDSKKLQERYGLESIVAAEAEDTAVGEVQTIDTVFEKRALQRQQATRWRKKATWAIHDCRKFNALITDIEFFLTNLEALVQHLGVVAVTRQREVTQHEIQEIKDPASARLLTAASDQPPDAQTGPATSNEPDVAAASQKLESHRFIRNIIGEQAQGILGDIGNVDPNAAKNEYTENNVSDRAQAVMGNVDGAFASTFFRR